MTQWQNRIKEYRPDCPVGELLDNQHNWRIHPAAQRAGLIRILDKVGIVDALKVYWSEVHDGLTIVDGHLRKAIDPAAMWPVLVLDIDDAEAALILATFDPLAAMAETDRQTMQELVDSLDVTGDLDIAGIWEDVDIDLDSILGVDYTEGADSAPQIDRAAELQAEWGVEVGQLWKLGEHRLICGDCTDATVVERVMGGELCSLVVTDPPYGVSYADKNSFLNSIDEGNRIQTPIKNDHATKEQTQSMWKSAFACMSNAMLPGAAVYCFMPQGGDQMMMMMMMMMTGAGMEPRHELIWLKNNHVLGRVDYSYKHEPVLYAWKKGGHKFYGGFQTSILEFARPNKSDLHPTTKPLQLIEKLITNSSLENAIVLDLFLGSGTTLIACENLNRQCRAIEIDPRYVAVAIQRWVDVTGGTPELIA